MEKEEQVRVLKTEQTALEKKVDILREELKDCRERKKRADTLMKSLASEKQKWIVCLRMLSGKFKNVTGDVLLGAAYITFLSGFSKSYRQKLLSDWIDVLLRGGFHVSTPKAFSIVELFGDTAKIRTWTSIHGLSTDDKSLSNAVIMDKTNHFTLCLDPQRLANQWLRKLHKESDLVVTKTNEALFISKVEDALNSGKVLLIENINDS